MSNALAQKYLIIPWAGYKNKVKKKAKHSGSLVKQVEILRNQIAKSWGDSSLDAVDEIKQQRNKQY